VLSSKLKSRTYEIAIPSHEIFRRYLNLNEGDHIEAAHQLLGDVIANMVEAPYTMGNYLDAARHLLDVSITKRDALIQTASKAITINIEPLVAYMIGKGVYEVKDRNVPEHLRRNWIEADLIALTAATTNNVKPKS
jgi:hypothetical protein